MVRPGKVSHRIALSINDIVHENHKCHCARLVRARHEIYADLHVETVPYYLIAVYEIATVHVKKSQMFL